MMSIKIKNIDQLMKAYGEVGEVFRKEMKDALDRSAAVVERDAKRKSPVARIAGGTLRRSIRPPRHPRIGDKQVAVGSNVKYALYQHEGLHFHHTTGEALYLKKALDMNEKKIRGFFKKMVNNIITKLAKYR